MSLNLRYTTLKVFIVLCFFNKQMREIKITPEMLKRALKRAKELGNLGENSILAGEGNLAGCLGEELILLDHPQFILENTYDYDLIHNGITIDVKANICTSTPKPFYNCTVTDINIDSDNDIYVFTRILDDNSVGWILGWKTKEKYLQESIFYKEGDIDPINKFIFKADCHVLQICDLKPLVDLEEYIAISDL